MSEGGWKKRGFVMPNGKMRLFLREEARKTGTTEEAADKQYTSEDGFEGEYRQITSAFDQIIRLHAASLTKVIGVVEPDGSGDLSRLIGELPGRKTNIERMGLPGGNLLDLINDAHTLSK